MKPRTLHALTCFLTAALLLLGPDTGAALAGQGLRVTVDAVKADKAGSHVDPELRDLVAELGPMFAYTAFTLLKTTTTRLTLGQTDLNPVSRDHGLELHLLGFAEGRARLRVRVLESSRERLSTVLLLVNGGSAVIGGPAYEDGVMLLRIRGEFY